MTRALGGVALALGLAGLTSCAAPAAPPPAPASAAPTPVVARMAPPPGFTPAPRGPEARWSGLAVEPTTEALAREANLPRAEGVFVRAVEGGSPGARAGIRQGDVLLLAGGKFLATPRALNEALQDARLGSAVELAGRRSGALYAAKLPVEPVPPGRLVAVLRLPQGGLLGVATDGGVLWGYGPVPGGSDRGIVPVPLPGGPTPPVGPRAVASPGAERVIAADGERVYLAWAGSEVNIDAYELRSGRVSRLAVSGTESLANRCRPQGLTRVVSELWMSCRVPEGVVLVRIDLGSGQARVEPLPPTYRRGLAFDGEAVLWLCCGDSAGSVALSRTELASGATKVFALREAATAVAADSRGVYLLGQREVYLHAPWR